MGLGFIDRVPVLRAINEVNARNGILQHLGAAVMISVRVRKDHVLDLVRIQSQLLQTTQDLVFGGVVEQSFDDDDALASDKRPGAVNFGAQ